jgi:predicted ribosomally synthesized peptide with SipW-like signal peptide
MKKKIMALGLVVAVAVLAIGGATLAYFTDSDDKTNEFSAGKVDITLNEVFDEDTAVLIPGQDIQKEVTISLEEGSLDTFVWYTYAIPAVLEGTDPVVEVSFDADGASDWTVLTDYETITLDGVDYNVHTALYNSALSAGDETSVGMSKVSLNPAVDYDVENDVYTMGGEEIGFDLNNVKIIVTAYGIQATGFENVQAAYSAYTTQSEAVSSAAADVD